MYIGKLAELTGASRKAIRLYETLGLLPTPERKGQYRVYTERDVHVVSLIRRAQSVGFGLSELKEITRRKASEAHFPLDLAYQLIAQKRKQVRDEMGRLETLDRELVLLKEELNHIFEQKKSA